MQRGLQCSDSQSISLETPTNVQGAISQQDTSAVCVLLHTCYALRCLYSYIDCSVVSASLHADSSLISITFGLIGRCVAPTDWKRTCGPSWYNCFLAVSQYDWSIQTNQHSVSSSLFDFYWSLSSLREAQPWSISPRLSKRELGNALLHAILPRSGHYLPHLQSDE